MKKAYHFDDVTLVPKFNKVESRLHVDLNSKLTKNTPIGIPIVASNMETVIGTDLAEIITKNKSIPIFHRFTGFEQKVEWLKEFPECFISCGVKPEEQDEVFKLIHEHGLKKIAIDVAHAHDSRVGKLVEKFKTENVEVIAGDVCTSEAFQFLVDSGADAVRVGIGVGSHCLTTNVTGFGLPQFSTILECAEVSRLFEVPMIADGGIRNSRDAVLALAAGAAVVMMGHPFAHSYEAAGSQPDSYKWNIYRGQASKEFQVEYYGQVKKGTVPEGKESAITPRASAQEIIDEFLGGIRSGLTYGGALNIQELQKNAEFRLYQTSRKAERGF